MIRFFRTLHLPTIPRPYVILLVAIAVGVFAYVSFSPTLPEVGELAKVSWTPQEYTAYFKDLAERKGAVYAFEVRRHAVFPPGIDTHALGHTIGYVLHKQQGGAKAILQCAKYEQHNDDACMHGVVIQEFITRGIDALADLARSCETAGRGTPAYYYCFHGIGHGIVAYLNYDFEASIDLCKEAAEAAVGEDADTDYQTEFVWKQCIDGASMEATLGQHDQVAWEKASPQYMPDDDLLMPCNASYMPDAMRMSCYAYARGRMLKAEGIRRDDTVFEPAAYARALAYCTDVPDVDDRKACYGGFGVYFTFAANGQDDRWFENMSDAAIQKVHDLCMLAPGRDAQSPCTLTAAEALVDKSDSARTILSFCAFAPDETIKDRCYTASVMFAEMYLSFPQFVLMCLRIPEPYAAACWDQLLGR